MEVTVHHTPNIKFMYELQPGDTWVPHPAGGILVCNPDRKPLWCHEVDGFLVQEFLEPAQPPLPEVEVELPGMGAVVLSPRWR